MPVEGKGAVHSYTEVHHAIQPAFKGHTPYLILLVDLDTQKGKPTEHEALRVVGNLATPDGKLAPPELVKRVGIGTRVRMVFTDVAPGLALPQWTIDDSARAAGEALALSAGVSELLRRSWRAIRHGEPAHDARAKSRACETLPPQLQPRREV